MSLRIEQLAVDVHDVERVATFWQELLGWERGEADDGEIALVPPPGTSEPELLFLPVPEDKVVKNRLHLDLRPDDQDAEVAKAESLGARRVDVGQSDEVTWVVLADPEGNEFCILRSR